MNPPVLHGALRAGAPRPLGPVMLDVAGLALDADDRRRLLHPGCGGVILFSRNFESPAQLAALVASIHALRTPSLPVGVDHEGGRVQRFRAGFTAIASMGSIGARWADDPADACRRAELAGHVMAAELRACGVDFTFAPVLDLALGRSDVIGDRAFHADPAAVTVLGRALVRGLRRAGMASVGKHFPGHGYAEADSHVDVPVDPRSLDDILAADALPYARLAPGDLAAVMPAHVVYPAVDALPAGFSSYWLQEVLRRRLGFDGAILSDDLSMEGARVAGDVCERGRAALGAGCDLVLVCNRPDLADQLLASPLPLVGAESARRLSALRGQERPGAEPAADALLRLQASAAHVAEINALAAI
jgi:beta-N-acetylhexosaminidase